MNKRLSIEQCIAHAWFKDYKVWNDKNLVLYGYHGADFESDENSNGTLGLRN